MKFVKRHRGKIPIPTGGSIRGTTVVYGDYGIRVASNGFRISAKSFRHIMGTEAAISTAAAMVLPAVVFKLNFTQADAPELVKGLGESIRNFTTGLDLVVQARVVFVMLAIMVGIVFVASLFMGSPGKGIRRHGGKTLLGTILRVSFSLLTSL